MKYHLFGKHRKVISTGRNSWELMGSYDTFEDVRKMVETSDDLGYDSRVIYGTELEWEIETEEVITKTVVEKSRKIKDVK
jgi:hypothetical protein